MPNNLVIVESPAKARTIEKYLGSGYTVKSSFGHIRDLPKKGLSIDKENNFKPSYEIPADKKKVITELKKDVKNASEVWLASDEDREGEAIAWHLCKALGLDEKSTKRIVFHEITKSAIENAVKNPRTVDKNLVDAQQARRILDRLVGYELSPVLWKKVRGGLSAGRVQSVAVRLIVERENEIKKFNATSKYKIYAYFLDENSELKAELEKTAKDEQEAIKILKELAKGPFTIVNIEKKDSSRSPGPPFTTSSLQQDASTKLGYNVKQTMSIAQKLYENGHITYMRTDSTNLSATAISSAKNYIVANYGNNYHSTRQFKTKNASAQEAHEAIRPTNFSNKDAGIDAQSKKLYNLIWRRTLASQMASAKIEKTTLFVTSGNYPDKLLIRGEVLKFDGFLKVYGKSKDDQILPEKSIGDKLELEFLEAQEAFDRSPARYSEASLVKKLEELGIGRPSTYAPTISTIQTRGYVEKTDSDGREREIKNIIFKNDELKIINKTEKTGVERARLHPTPVAEITTDFLSKHFSSIVDYDFTAKAENNFDQIAEGNTTWQNVIKDFYKDFHPLVEKSENISRSEASNARLLGEDPKDKKPVFARFGRFGPMIQKGEATDEEKPTFAPMPKGRTIDNVTLDQALEMFKLPRKVGKTKKGEEIIANIGRFGPYVQVGKTFVSIKPHDPFSIDEGLALELYENKLKKEADKYINQFSSGISVVNGPYGPYITDGKKNARIPKDTDPKSIDETQAKELLKKAPTKKARRKKK